MCVRVCAHACPQVCTCCLYIYLCITCMQCLGRLEGVIRSPGPGVIHGCELLWGCWEPNRSPGILVNDLNCWASSVAPQLGLTLFTYVYVWVWQCSVILCMSVYECGCAQLCVCVYECGCAQYHSAQVEVRGHCLGVSALLSSCEIQDLNSGH